jgi:toxin-antitoxin system PIN domain toxin
VILIDANLLVYAHVDSMDQHTAARTWLDDQLNTGARVGLPWPSLLSFVRLVSNPRIFARAETVASAWRQVEDWLGCATVWIPQPTDRHADILQGFLNRHALKSNLVPDAHLAALAVEHGLSLCSTDGDFARFEGLQWVNPLEASS